MTVTKNFDMKIIIDSDIVKQYLEKADTEEIEKLIEKTDSDSMNKLVAKYLTKYFQKMSQDNPEKFKKFVGMEEEVKETKNDVSDNNSEYKTGDIVFMRRTSLTGFMLDGYDKYHLTTFGPWVTLKNSSGKTYKISPDVFKDMIKVGEVYICRGEK